MRHGGAAAVVALALFARAEPAWAACPCYTLSSAGNDHNCGVEAVEGTNPTPAEWQGIFDLVAQGPSVWGAAGPSVRTMGQGCEKPTAPSSVSPFFPCDLVKAITMQESGWRQFCAPTTPSDMAGRSSRTLISFDCGYGVGQVTSGMHRGEDPAFDRARVASEATYNLAAGMQILTDKWNQANCVGDALPWIVEHWYSATWAYNGRVASNNPNNPAFDSTRGVWNPKVGGSAPYQEKVFGWLEFPPSEAHWTAVPAAYPDSAELGTGGVAPELSEPDCAGPTDCWSRRQRHVSSCYRGDGGGTAVDAGSPATDAGGPTVDAGVLPDGGALPPGSLPWASGELGRPPSGCGCNCGVGTAAIAIFSAPLLRRRRAGR